jgi:hypothetical protein
MHTRCDRIIKQSQSETGISSKGKSISHNVMIILMYKSSSYICGHRTVKIPHPVRSAKSSTVSPSQYCGGGPRGNPGCCSYLFCCFLFGIDSAWTEDAPLVSSMVMEVYRYAQVKNKKSIHEPRSPTNQMLIKLRESISLPRLFFSSTSTLHVSSLDTNHFTILYLKTVKQLGCLLGCLDA